MRSGALLALFVHIGLVGALALAVSWRASTPAPVMAELWSPIAQDAAPREQEPEPTPAPQPEPERRAPPPPAPTPKAEPQADIALKKAREAEKKERERQAAEERRRGRVVEPGRRIAAGDPGSVGLPGGDVGEEFTP